MVLTISPLVYCLICTDLRFASWLRVFNLRLQFMSYLQKLASIFVILGVMYKNCNVICNGPWIRSSNLWFEFRRCWSLVHFITSAGCKNSNRMNKEEFIQLVTWLQNIIMHWEKYVVSKIFSRQSSLHLQICADHRLWESVPPSGFLANPQP